ncbi:hypothetical protein ABW21_db0204411 [Orbilia brochopaga]|nr:hypothetical protein ABW21_db0204411 [Drechslerella brochopaga]
MERSLLETTTDVEYAAPNRKKLRLPRFTMPHLKCNFGGKLVRAQRPASDGDNQILHRSRGFRYFSSPERPPQPIDEAAAVEIEHASEVEDTITVGPETISTEWSFDISQHLDELEWIRPASGTWGPSLLIRGQHSGYNCISADAEATEVFNREIETFCAWVEERYQGGYAFTLLLLRDKPTVLLILYQAAELPTSCPVFPFPVEILSGEIINYIFENYDKDPRSPWFDRALQPGSSLTCQQMQTGSFGGFVTATNGKTWGLTAGHVGRKFLSQEAFVQTKLKMASPSERDLRRARLESKKLIFGLKEDIKDAKETLKDETKTWKKNPEDTGKKLKAQEAYKEKALHSSRLKACKVVSANATESETRCGTVAASCMDYSTFGVQEKGWKRTEDWGLVDVESGRSGRNIIKLWEKEVPFAGTTTLSAGQIVLKRGRSTGVTFGKVNGVQLHIKVEQQMKTTAEWVILPLDTPEIWQAEFMKEYRQTGWRDELGRGLITDKFADVGDSGSLVIDAESRKVCGMVLGGFPTGRLPITVTTPIDLILTGVEKRLKVKFDQNAFST